ncbi:MAG: hypothetical protein LBS69_02615 [Prevotellaceae bacterium]|jgi:RHS repeat-associated protein|nr:hypothetical protein [Prevotellaceae bacterium]
MQNSQTKATYTYIADGTKAGVKDSAGKGFDYLGTFVYTNENNVRTLESTNFGGGRINKTNNAYDINYFITDHLGSTRVIVNSNGEIKEQKDFYPFGKEHENPNLTSSTNRWGFSGKEKQTIRDLGYWDYSARMYDDFLGKWFVIDRFTEKYYSLSPYSYAALNPVNNIDINGDSVWITQRTGFLGLGKKQTLLYETVSFLGEYCGYEFIGGSWIGESLILYSYMVKYKVQPLKFTFIFYKAKDNWTIQNFNFDNSLIQELKETAEFYTIKGKLNIYE